MARGSLARPRRWRAVTRKVMTSRHEALVEMDVEVGRDAARAVVLDVGELVGKARVWWSYTSSSTPTVSPRRCADPP